ncbi:MULTISPECIES: DUF6126 family protein [unclassified Streptomyces]|uniref:DUF6126 family protein n=1 Tax=unclassified Streptomyces TaxID=2593676 RepID=UPI0036B18BA7
MSQGENVTATAHEAPGVPANDVPATGPVDGTGSVERTGPADAQETGSAPDTLLKRFESKFPRGLIIRLIAYLFVGHLFAFFVYLLFVLGAENQ